MNVAEKLHPQFVTDDRGRRQAVLLPLGEYEALLEDLADLAVVAERREEGTISHEDVINKLKRTHLL